MKRSWPTWMVALACAATMGAAALFAQPQQSEDFRITKSVIDAGGAQGTSADFRLYSAFGQPTPIGAQSSADFVLYAGYLSPSFAVSPLSPIQDLVIQVQQPNVRLHWDPIAGAERYKIYRDTNPSFTPGESNQIGTTADTFYVDVNAVLLLPGVRYYYSVKASNMPHPLVATPPEAESDAVLKKPAQETSVKRGK